jgi:hypothetical protein
MMLNEYVQDGTLITLIGLIYADFYFHLRKSVKISGISVLLRVGWNADLRDWC